MRHRKLEIHKDKIRLCKNRVERDLFVFLKILLRRCNDDGGKSTLIYQKLGHVNFGLIPGRGVFSHPSGPRAGAQSLHQAWEAIREKKSLEVKAGESGCNALAQALKVWS